MPRYEAYILKDWEKQGMTRVIVARTQDGGCLDVGGFLVDSFCLGVKDAYLAEIQAADWPHELDRMMPVEERVAMQPACARKLIEGAVAYAEALGIMPHRDYKKARRAFGSVRASDCPETFTYGESGKPLFMAGPHDDKDRIDRVLRILTAKLGPEGFHYVVPVEDDELEDDDLLVGEHLQEYFTAVGRETDRHVLGGMCAAVSVRRAVIDPVELIPILWNGNPPAAGGRDSMQELGDLISDYLSETEDRLEFADEPEAIPHFADDPWGNDAELRDRARAWCRGFMRAVRTWPEAWNVVFHGADLQQHLGLIIAVAEESEATTLTEPIPANELPGAIGVALLALNAAMPEDPS
jgi:uncharacterized protein YecA (UPF0149 family)